MCFSLSADLVVGTVLLPVAVLALREVQHWREWPFALLPSVFAVPVHRGRNLGGAGRRSLRRATQFAIRAHLFIALPLLPTLFPLSVLLLEPRGVRLRVAPFVALGAVVSAYLAVVVLAHPVVVIEHPHALQYQTAVENQYVWTVLYVVAVIGPALMSGYTSIVAFGALNLLGLTVVAMFYVQAFASLWCIYAAAISTLLLHMVRRRQLPDSHRLRGEALRSPSPPTGEGGPWLRIRPQSQAAGIDCHAASLRPAVGRCCIGTAVLRHPSVCACSGRQSR